MRALKIAGLAMNGLRRSPLRVTLTTLGVTFACGALVTMVALAIGIQRQVETPFRALAMLNNIQVRPKEGKDADKAPPLDDAALANIEKLPGVAAAYPDVHIKGIKVRYEKKEAIAIGIALPREASLLGVADEFIVAGRLFDEGNRPEAILGLSVVKELGFKTPAEAVGKQIALEAAGLTPDGGDKFTYQQTTMALTVIGVYEAPALLPGAARQGILLPVELMKDIPGIHLDSALSRLKSGGPIVTSGYASATVRVRDPAMLHEVQVKLTAMGFSTEAMLNKLQHMRQFFLAIQMLLSVVGSVALIIAALGIVNTLLMAVMERYQEIGLCKAIGASDGDLFILFLTEAGIIGCLGGLTGLGLGWLVSQLMELVAGFYARGQGITGRLNLFAFPLWMVAVTVAFAILVSIVAGIYPALRAARVDPIRALRSH